MFDVSRINALATNLSRETMPVSRTARQSTCHDLWLRWRRALAHAGTTNRAWAQARGLSGEHVAAVVKGVRPSARLHADVVEWVERQEEDMRADLSQSAAA
jgi:hypothetical protein